MTNSPDSPLEGGNTKTPSKQIPASIRWCFTFNNYSEQEYNQLVPKIAIYCKKYIISHEGEKVCMRMTHPAGDSSTDTTPHLQGYVEFKKRRRPMNLFINKIHWEKAKGNAQENYLYCGKDGHIKIKHGFPPEWACELTNVLRMDELRPWEHDIIRNIGERPDDRTIYWYWSSAGNLGKTTFTKYLVVRENATILSGKGADVRNGVIEYKKKNGFTPHLVVYPIPRSFNSDYLSYEAIENVKDMLFYSGKYEGGVICGNCPHVIVFANTPPDTERMSKDRWKIFEISEDHTASEWTPPEKKRLL